ncbi:MAG TPA: hypothetical protein PKJ16_18410, partial [Spirochaetota bacterium]|nr:hypothetical protein [Spirochaetota bacterium]
SSCSSKSGGDGGGGSGGGVGASVPSRVYRINYSSGVVVGFNFRSLFVQNAWAAELQAYKVAEFDADTGKLKKVILYNGSGLSDSYYDYELNADGRPTRHYCRNTDGTLWYQYHMTWNAEKKITEFYSKKANGTTDTYIEFLYLPDGNLEWLKQWNDNTRVTLYYRLKNVYDTDGNLIRVYAGTASGIERFEVTYPESGKRRIDIFQHATMDDPTSGDGSNYRVFTYDEKNRLVHILFGDSNTERVYEYAKESVSEDKSDEWETWYNLPVNLQAWIDGPQ